MDDLERIHAKEKIKKWKRSLSKEDWQEYKKKVNSSKEVEYEILNITKRIDKAIEDKNKVSVEEERKSLQQTYFNSYVLKKNKVLDCLPPSLQRSYHLVYVIPVICLQNTYIEKIKEFQTKPPYSPPSPTILVTMSAISRCENSLSAETKTMLQTKKLERRSIRGQITKAINKLRKDIDAGDSFAVTITKASLLKTLEESGKKG